MIRVICIDRSILNLNYIRVVYKGGANICMRDLDLMMWGSPGWNVQENEFSDSAGLRCKICSRRSAVRGIVRCDITSQCSFYWGGQDRRKDDAQGGKRD